MTRQNCTNNTPDFPTSHTHIYGYGVAYNGTISNKEIEHSISNTYDFNRYAKIYDDAINDVYEFSFLLKAGTYKIQFSHDKDTTRGIASIYLNNSLIGTLDCYAASRINAQRVEYTVTITKSGTQNLKIKILSRNSSGTAYRFGCSAIYIIPVITQTTTRINCGGNRYIDSLSQEWLADAYFAGGNSYDIESYIGTYTVTGTNDQTLYKFERSLDVGSFTYTIPIATGVYNFNLLFSENNKTASGQRVGTVALNGSNLLTNFDIFAQAGGQHKALIKSYVNQSLSAFTLTITNTLINGIELIRVS